MTAALGVSTSLTRWTGVADKRLSLLSSPRTSPRAHCTELGGDEGWDVGWETLCLQFSVEVVTLMKSTLALL